MNSATQYVVLQCSQMHSLFYSLSLSLSPTLSLLLLLLLLLFFLFLSLPTPLLLLLPNKPRALLSSTRGPIYGQGGGWITVGGRLVVARKLDLDPVPTIENLLCTDNWEVDPIPVDLGTVPAIENLPFTGDWEVDPIRVDLGPASAVEKLILNQLKTWLSFKAWEFTLQMAELLGWCGWFGVVDRLDHGNCNFGWVVVCCELSSWWHLLGVSWMVL